MASIFIYHIIAILNTEVFLRILINNFYFVGSKNWLLSKLFFKTNVYLIRTKPDLHGKDFFHNVKAFIMS